MHVSSINKYLKFCVGFSAGNFNRINTTNNEAQQNVHFSIEKKNIQTKQKHMPYQNRTQHVESENKAQTENVIR